MRPRKASFSGSTNGSTFRTCGSTRPGIPIPESSASWFYVFGSATLLCFILQIITGSLLAFVYVPSASEAYDSLLYLTYEQDLGWYLRAMHYWGSNFMVGAMLLHMTQVLSLWAPTSIRAKSLGCPV